MSEEYIKAHFTDIKGYASAIEDRGEDEDCTMEGVMEDNRKCLALARAHGVNYILIDGDYKVDF